MSLSGGKVSLRKNLAESGLTLIAFTVVIVTEDNPYVEMLILDEPCVNKDKFTLTSRKFSFGNNDPAIVSFFQWIEFKNFDPNSRTAYFA